MQTVIRIKPAKVRKAPAPKTCCTTHNDKCRFGRQHVYAGPFLLDSGRPVDGEIWSAPGVVHCQGCGGTCYGDADDSALVERYRADA